MNTFVLPSYAKLNLLLRIKGRRQDGYHELVTLFERIDLKDELCFSSRKDGAVRVACDHPAVPCDSRNLVHKVAVLLRETCGVHAGADIRIRKNIPVAAGLAGGSSNAACALTGLNRLWRLGLKRDELVALAASIGSDVAFFLYDTPWALGTGRGEKIRALDLPVRVHHLLITPRRPLLTKEVYAAYGRVRRRSAALTKAGSDVRILVRCLQRTDIKTAGEHLANDLERGISALDPRLLKLKARLQKEPAQSGVSFSGSGPSIFALTRTRQEALELRKKYARVYGQVFAVATR